MNLSRVFIIACWAWGASELLLQIVTRTSRSTGAVKDRGSLLILVPAIYASIFTATWYGDRHAPTMPGGAQWMTSAALAILLAGLAIRWTAILTLGVSFSTNVAIHASQTVRKTGPYRWMRHPSYTGTLVSLAAIGVVERNWVSLAIVLVVPAAALLYRIHVEERALTEAFGEEYVEYSKVTKRLVPGIY
jgi:protein-S-isoprenylcysteine O-methyltransferase Ste14